MANRNINRRQQPPTGGETRGGPSGGDDFKPIYGCADPTALNFNPSANTNDGSCIYDSDGFGAEGLFWIWECPDGSTWTHCNDEMQGPPQSTIQDFLYICANKNDCYFGCQDGPDENFSNYCNSPYYDYHWQNDICCSDDPYPINHPYWDNNVDMSFPPNRVSWEPHDMIMVVGCGANGDECVDLNPFKNDFIYRMCSLIIIPEEGYQHAYNSIGSANSYLQPDYPIYVPGGGFQTSIMLSQTGENPNLGDPWDVTEETPNCHMDSKLQIYVYKRSRGLLYRTDLPNSLIISKIFDYDVMSSSPTFGDNWYDWVPWWAGPEYDGIEHTWYPEFGSPLEFAKLLPLGEFQYVGCTDSSALNYNPQNEVQPPNSCYYGEEECRWPCPGGRDEECIQYEEFGLYDTGRMFCLDYCCMERSPAPSTIPTPQGRLNGQQLDRLSNVPSIPSIISDTEMECNEETEVELWGECYNIETTTELIILNNFNYSGPIPPQIGNLVNLTEIALSGNGLTGSIPTEIGNLINLERLYLNNNQLTGEIPFSIENLTNLQILALNNNNLTGQIPYIIRNLENLITVFLQNNNLSGEIPYEIGFLTNLENLILNNNQITGEIPDNICNLNLDFSDSYKFNISNNNICPPLPYTGCIFEEDIGYQDTSNCGEISCADSSEVFLPEWGNCNDMNPQVSYYASYNIWTDGCMPSGCFSIPNTTYIDISDWWSNWGYIREIPPAIENLINLKELKIVWQNLGRFDEDDPRNLRIPPELGNLTNLCKLTLNRTALTGGIPPELANLTNLNSLDLLGNNFGCYLYDCSIQCEDINPSTNLPYCDASLPPKIGNLKMLHRISAGGSNIQGNIPESISDMTYLTFLSLGGNNLTGQIPSDIGNLEHLIELQLSNNQLTGPIPESIGSLGSNLPIYSWDDYYAATEYNPAAHCFCAAGCNTCPEGFPLGIWGSDYTWSLSQWPGSASISGLGMLDLSYNNLTGPIPESIGNLDGVKTYNHGHIKLNNNQLSGQIPESICNYDFHTPYEEVYLNLQNNNLCPLIEMGVNEDGEDELIYTWPSCFPMHEWADYPLYVGNQSGDECPLTCPEGYTPIFSQCYSNEETTVLQRPNEGITGEIPSDIGNLTNLQHLDLRDNQLTGQIPSEIGNLTNLNYLWLSDNQLNGEIPSEIGNLTNLRYLDLAYNNLFGEIPPEIGNLIKLYELSLSNNYLSGQIPEEIVSLHTHPDYVQSSLRVYLQNNELGKILNLEDVEIGENEDFEGSLVTGVPFPEWICNWDNIWNSTVQNPLNVGNNSFCPPYPECITDSNNTDQDSTLCPCDGEDLVELFGECFYIPSTTVLNFSSSQLSGPIPPEIGRLVNLVYLNLGYNNFTSIPDEIGNLTNLQTLILSHNSIGVAGNVPNTNCSEETGCGLPESIGNLTELRYLDLERFDSIWTNDASLNYYIAFREEDGNIPAQGPVGWMLPPSIGNLTNLEELNISYTNLRGAVPDIIGNLTNLESFEMRQTKISSTLLPNSAEAPDGPEGQPGPWQYSWSFSGGERDLILEQFYNYWNLEIPYPEENWSWDKYRYPIPQSINNLINLNYFNCQSSSTGGPFPNMEGMISLKYLNFNYNNLEGTQLPQHLFSLPQIQDIRLSGCQLHGEILSENIPNFAPNLLVLMLESNKLTGDIPEEIENFTNLTALVLDRNRLGCSIGHQSYNQPCIEACDGTNGCSGELPPSIGNMTNLNMLDLEWNHFRGHIPESLSNCIGLEKLYLGNNDFTGPIPYNIGNIGQSSDMSYIELYNNNLTGNIPMSLFTTPHMIDRLRTLRVFGNQLTGFIPSEICELNFIDTGNQSSSFRFEENNLCSPYPNCLDENTVQPDTQNTEDCPEIDELIFGCTYDNACNYNWQATYDDGSCLFPSGECTCQETAAGFIDTGCGCDAITYTCPDGSTQCYPSDCGMYGCLDSNSSCYDPYANWSAPWMCNMCTGEVIYGCTDESATNYNENAQYFDYSCEYAEYNFMQSLCEPFILFLTIDVSGSMQLEGLLAALDIIQYYYFELGDEALLEGIGFNTMFADSNLDFYSTDIVEPIIAINTLCNWSDMFDNYGEVEHQMCDMFASDEQFQYDGTRSIYCFIDSLYDGYNKLLNYPTNSAKILYSFTDEPCLRFDLDESNCSCDIGTMDSMEMYEFISGINTGAINHFYIQTQFSFSGSGGDFANPYQCDMGNNFEHLACDVPYQNTQPPFGQWFPDGPYITYTNYPLTEMVCSYCDVPEALNYGEQCTCFTMNCCCVYDEGVIPGCTDETAPNYNPDATVDDGTCAYCNYVFCYDQSTGSLALKPCCVYDYDYNLGLSTNCEECFGGDFTELPIGEDDDDDPDEYPACPDGSAPNVCCPDTNGDSSCDSNNPIYWIVTCDDCPVGYIPPGSPDGEQLAGCMDPDALNYNPLAEVDDGSCVYEDVTDPGDEVDPGDGPITPLSFPSNYPEDSFMPDWMTTNIFRYGSTCPSEKACYWDWNCPKENGRYMKCSFRNFPVVSTSSTGCCVSRNTDQNFSSREILIDDILNLQKR